MKYRKVKTEAWGMVDKNGNEIWNDDDDADIRDLYLDDEAFNDSPKGPCRMCGKVGCDCIVAKKFKEEDSMCEICGGMKNEGTCECAMNELDADDVVKMGKNYMKRVDKRASNIAQNAMQIGKAVASGGPAGVVKAAKSGKLKHPGLDNWDEAELKEASLAQAKVSGPLQKFHMSIKQAQAALGELAQQVSDKRAMDQATWLLNATKKILSALDNMPELTKDPWHGVRESRDLMCELCGGVKAEGTCECNMVETDREPSWYDYDDTDMGIDAKRSAAAEKARRSARKSPYDDPEWKPTAESTFRDLIQSIVSEMKLSVASRGHFDFGGAEEMDVDDIAHFLLSKKDASGAEKAPKSGVKIKSQGKKQKSKKTA